MFDDSRAFVSRAFLRAHFALEFKAYQAGEADAELLGRLRAWAERLQLSEVQAEGAFIQAFFVETWGYGDAGRVPADEVTLIPKLRIAGEGAGGGAGEADLALGWFRHNPAATPQVLAEFKDIRSNLDTKQNRKGSNRSPVEQCLNYVRGARRGLFGNEPVQPWWGLVTDMNEFRLYWWDRAPAQYLRFVIQRPHELFGGDYDLLSDSEDARFDRFLFSRIFQRDFLLSPAGRPPLLRLIERQWVRERQLEGEFYERYKAVRERLFNVLRVTNPQFPGTPTELLRISQKILDRFIFVFYCEDMGERMLFPPQLVREYLKTRSGEAFYDPGGNELWSFFKRLFGALDNGGQIGLLEVREINGGLFAADPQIQALDLPNHVFATPGQGANEASLERDRDTLFYLSARYNYASRGEVRESLSLYTLGRIFEQSITELEYRAGELEGRDSIAKLSKRKRDGVYYTPEWVVNLLVGQALDPWFATQKAACGWPAEDVGPPTRPQVEAYEQRLQQIRIVDPACGSGAFLISAFRRLLEERIAVEREKALLAGGAVVAGVDEAALTADILAGNIYGVDINPASVEIAKLALWLHSARPDSPLSSLDHTLRCGNSLVGPDFWGGRPADDAHRERINAFDWRAAFPEVWPEGQAGGFDIVLGNPPYVKLQNLHAVDPDVAAYLQANRGDDTYLSAQTGNFDLYLPFIEKGLRLLGPGGRMAYIAPSLWTVNQHGEGLRRLVRHGRHLERWIDFKAFQVFDEAITYTALQFFTRDPQDSVRIAVASDGEAADVDWTDEELVVPYDALPEAGVWLMATGADRVLLDRLTAACLRLDDPALTSAIFQGLITSADAIFHLKRMGAGQYLCSPREGPAYHVDLEDVIMKPLISGPEAKRYEDPETDTFLLFPYRRDDRGVTRLISAPDMQARFPRAWRYLQSWENQLRAREAKRLRGREIRPFDDDAWYRFGRNQNIDKQDITKLIVAQTVPGMRVCADVAANKYLNNVRVNGILAAEGADQFYLLGALNGPVADFVFRRIGKPKIGGWFEANKQFIAPLPIPRASPKDTATVAGLARNLQGGWTARRELLTGAGDRLSVLARARKNERWLWPDLPGIETLVERAPTALRLAGERRDWAHASLDEAIETRCEALQAQLDGGGRLEVAFRDGELKLFAGGSVVLQRIYLDDAHGQLTEAYWRWLLLSRAWREADRLSAELRRPPSEPGTPAATQFMDKVNELADDILAIENGERTMNEHLYRLYGLAPHERLLIEGELTRRA